MATTETSHGQLIQAAIEAAKHSYSPYSNFPVGAAVLTAKGTVYKGTNVENASYGGTICAERSAICSAVSNGERDFVAIAVVTRLDEPASPCGICRQFMAEFDTTATTSKDLKVILYSPSTGKRTETSVRDLLPHAFTPKSFEQ